MLLLFWKGLGFLVPLITLVISSLVVVMFYSLFGEYYGNAYLGLGFSASAVTLWFLGKKLHSAPDKIFIEKETGLEVTIKPSHSFYWVKMHYWAFILVVFSIYCFANPTIK